MGTPLEEQLSALDAKALSEIGRDRPDEFVIKTQPPGHFDPENATRAARPASNPLGGPMIRMRTALITAGTFLLVASCGNSDANLGDGQGAATATGGAAGTSGNVDKDAAVGTGGSAGSSTTGTGGCGLGLGIACASDSGSGTGVGGGANADSGSTADASGPLSWMVTCGDPVCRLDTSDAGVDSGLASCSGDQKAGSACTTAGSTCDPGLGCGQKLTCADHRLDVMCPKSNRALKQDIRYLSHDDLQRLSDEVAKVRLTTYTYRDPSLGTDEHLGFIIEDNPKSPAVYPNQQHVDLYGYASMAVAALQVQKEQLRAQEQQMAELHREVTTLRDELLATRNSNCRP